MSKHPVDVAAEIMGSQVALASALGVTKAAVSQWKDEGRRVPAEHCPAIERLTGGKVRCEDLRPDVPWDVLREQPATPTPPDTPASPAPTAALKEPAPTAAAEPCNALHVVAEDHPTACDDLQLVEGGGLLATEPGNERADYPAKPKREGGAARTRRTDMHSPERPC